MTPNPNVLTAEVELGCPDLDAALEVFQALGFRIETILPADDPRTAVISGHGARLRLLRGAEPPAGTVRLVCRDPAALARGLPKASGANEASRVVLAGGIRVTLVAEDVLPAIAPLRPTFTVTRNDDTTWKVGRAGMHYRDLLPDRQGGRFIASHIRIVEGGPVPDYVHFHAIRFQMIACYKGWVRLVYEDQGEPFVMHAGECVIQPPRIRHRVLECSPGLEVIEIGTPAVHATHADHDMTLPTPTLRADRDFEGQRFVWHRASGKGFEEGSLGIAAASGEVASARVLRSADRARSVHDAELLFGFVLQGGLTVTCDDRVERVGTADAFAIPARHPFALEAPTADLAWLEVTLPASVRYEPAPKA